jgi:SIR2-like domain
MLTLDQLARRVRPDRTILMFGAGASIPSGAPSGLALATQLSTHLGLQPPSSDLAEVASIFENREGRPALINSIRSALKDLQPAGGLTIIPVFAWHSLYTTNYDQLVERAYAKDRKDLRVIRSNYDFTTTRSLDIADSVPTLYKLHGCVSQDVVDGHDSRILVTERDLEDFDSYRQALFRNLEFEMMTKDTLVIGQSLRDPHLRALVTKVSQIHEKQGTPGQIFVLSYSEDQDRALLLEQRGAQVAFGALDTFMQALLEFSPAPEPSVYTTETPLPGQLPIELRVATVDVAQAAGLSPNALRLFNGSAATYADIRGGLTIPRAVVTVQGGAGAGSHGSPWNSRRRAARGLMPCLRAVEM